MDHTILLHPVRCFPCAFQSPDMLKPATSFTGSCNVERAHLLDRNIQTSDMFRMGIQRCSECRWLCMSARISEKSKRSCGYLLLCVFSSKEKKRVSYHPAMFLQYYMYFDDLCLFKKNVLCPRTDKLLINNYTIYSFVFIP